MIGYLVPNRMLFLWSPFGRATDEADEQQAVGQAADHLIQGGWGMTRTTQGGALLADRGGEQRLSRERSLVRERNDVWNATEGKAGSCRRAQQQCVAGVGPARAGRRLCRSLPPERIRQPAPGGCRSRDGNARPGERHHNPTTGYRDGSCAGRGSGRGCTRAARTVGRRTKYSESPRQPGDARRAAPSTIESTTSPPGCVSRSPHCGGATS